MGYHITAMKKKLTAHEEKANEPCLRTGVSEHLDHLKAT